MAVWTCASFCGLADYFTLDGGALRSALTSTVTWNANRGITLGAGGGTLMQPGPGTLIYNGIIAGTSGGGLTINSTEPQAAARPLGL